jgi:hypothetical protein
MPTFYRITRTDPPTLWDFRSAKDRGRREPESAEERRLWDGISVYATEAQARRKARSLPLLGRFIAAVVLSEDDSVRVERTLSTAGHHTLWGDAALLLERVESWVLV